MLSPKITFFNFRAVRRSKVGIVPRSNADYIKLNINIGPRNFQVASGSLREERGMAPANCRDEACLALDQTECR